MRATAPNRQIDVEDPVPGQQVRDETAEHGGDYAADGINGDDGTLPATAFRGRHQIADDDLAERQQPARAHALHGAKENELRQSARGAAQYRAQQEHEYGAVQHRPASVVVAELAVQRHGTGRGEHIGRDHPR